MELFSLNFSPCINNETHHLSKRIKKRTGLPKRCHDHFLKKAIEFGLTVEDIKSKSVLYYYIKSITKEGYTLIIYSKYIIIISENGAGITLLNLPKEYQKIANPILKEKYKEREVKH